MDRLPLDKLLSRFLKTMLSGANAMQLSLFYRQLTALLNSGISPAQSMEILSREGENRKLQDAAREIARRLQLGETVSNTFASYPWIFSDLQISILRAGEQTGDLANCTRRLADYLEWEHQLRQKIRAKTTYSKICLLTFMFIPNIYMLVMGGIEAYIQATVGLFIRIVISGMIIWLAYLCTNQIPGVNYFFDTIKLALPKAGRMIRMRALARFYRSLAAMYSAGVPLTLGLGYAADTAGNGYLKRQLRSAIPGVTEGQSIVECLERTSVLPKIAIGMLHTGKLTGNLDVVLDKLAEYTEKETEFEVDQTLTILPVVLLGLVIALITYAVVGFYLANIRGYG